MPCVEKGRGPEGAIAADMQALCPARLHGGDFEHQLSRLGRRQASCRQTGGFYTGAAARTLARDRPASEAARISPMGAAARGPRVKYAAAS